MLKDFTDGSVAKENALFTTQRNAISLIMYQDSFEIVNPLGSAKRKHKILAVYVTLGNIHPQYRSKIDKLQLVLLLREIDFKYFGQAAVFRPLIKDLRTMETNGVLVGNENIPGILAMFLGDNLGSHCIGGFVENFSSSEYICRFCMITTQDIKLGKVQDNFEER